MAEYKHGIYTYAGPLSRSKPAPTEPKHFKLGTSKLGSAVLS